MKTIQIRQTRHAGYCWRSRDELIRDVLQWTPSHGRAKACEDMGCSPEDLPEVMNNRERWQERVRGICADGTTRWWDDDTCLNNYKAQLDYIFINKKEIITAVYCEAYFAFKGISSDHRIVTAKICLSLYRNKKKKIKKKQSKPYVMTGPYLPIEILAKNIWYL